MLEQPSKRRSKSISRAWRGADASPDQ